LLVTNLPNVELISADQTVVSINVSSLDLSAIDETYKPEEVASRSAYMIDALGSGNFTLEFTDVVDASAIKVYKVDPSSTPPNQWIELDYTTTASTVTLTMGVGDPPVVFAGPIAPPSPAPPMVPAMDKWGIVAMIALFAGLLVWMVRRRRFAS
jgi:hypothetical protein